MPSKSRRKGWQKLNGYVKKTVKAKYEADTGNEIEL